ncbi:Oxysterol-binding protein 8 [Porphyridium purpureum]|uniref:Oxysterol-binding protein 8 n=1 Tax=Porphyridium purpureum TaxID=35688 RepID=A0A5J4Z0F5_PORPP|nr:Oxysterol-binding protein 8 [Porphyridium purpureum]|eukprot:POR7445..scf208_2
MLCSHANLNRRAVRAEPNRAEAPVSDMNAARNACVVQQRCSTGAAGAARQGRSSWGYAQHAPSAAAFWLRAQLSSKRTMSTWSQWLGIGGSADEQAPAEGTQTAEDDAKTVEKVREALATGQATGESHHLVYEGKEVNEEEYKKSAFAQYASMVGMEMNQAGVSLSLPIFIFEPSTTLSRMCETWEFSHVMNTAAEQTDPVMRYAYASAAIVSGYAHSVRLLKPFDSVPGETFELEDKDLGFRYVGEHIRDEPPLSVAFCEGKGWTFTEDVQVNAKFHGNSVEISNKGHRKIVFLDTGEVLTWRFPTTSVCNLFVGSSYVDHYGSLFITSNKSDYEVDLEFSQCGWFESGRYDVTGHIKDGSGKDVLRLVGKWNSHVDSCKPGDEEHVTRLWTAGEHVDANSKWNYTNFSENFFKAGTEALKSAPPTDSRRRKDIMKLYEGHSKEASEARSRIEQIRVTRSQSLDKDNPTARWFTPANVSEAFTEWEYTGKYWEATRNLTDEQRREMTLF